jgi:hypothetical protein
MPRGSIFLKAFSFAWEAVFCICGGAQAAEWPVLSAGAIEIRSKAAIGAS